MGTTFHAGIVLESSLDRQKLNTGKCKQIVFAFQIHVLSKPRQNLNHDTMQTQKISDDKLIV